MKPNPDYKHAEEPSLAELQAFILSRNNSKATLNNFIEADYERDEMLAEAVAYYSTPGGAKELREATLTSVRDDLTALAMDSNSTHDKERNELERQIRVLEGKEEGESVPGAEVFEMLALCRENQVTDYLVQKANDGKQITESKLIAGIEHEQNLDIIANRLRLSSQLSPEATSALFNHEKLSQKLVDFLTTHGDTSLSYKAVATGKTSEEAESYAAESFTDLSAAALTIEPHASNHIRSAVTRPDVIAHAHQNKLLQQRMAQPEYMKDIQTASGMELSYVLRDNESKGALRSYLAKDANLSDVEFVKLAEVTGRKNFLDTVTVNPRIPKATREAALKNPSLDHITLTRLAENTSSTAGEIDRISDIAASGEIPHSQSVWSPIITNTNTSQKTLDSAVKVYLEGSRNSPVYNSPKVLSAIISRSTDTNAVKESIARLSMSREPSSQTLIKDTFNSRPELFDTDKVQHVAIDSYDYINRAARGSRDASGNVTIPTQLATNLMERHHASAPVMEHFLRTIHSNPYLAGNPDIVSLKTRISTYIKEIGK